MEQKTNSETISEIIRKLKIFFEEEPEKVQLWLNSPNMNLGNISPAYLIRCGRAHRVLQFINFAAEAGEWDKKEGFNGKEI